MKRFGFALFSVVCLTCCTTCLCAQDTPLKKVTFLPLWKPQAQFAGYYVAMEKGIYKKYGLDVSIPENGPADFSVLWLSSALKQRSGGVDLVNIGQIVQRSGLMFVAHKKSGIEKPQDLSGKKVSFWQGDLQLQPKAFLRTYGLRVMEVPQAYSVTLFLMGGVDAAAAMWYNEYHTIISSGVDPDELTTFFFSDHGLNVPEDGLYCLRATLENDPQAAADFVRASLEGWRYAFEHQDEAVTIVLKFMAQAHVPANRVHQRWMLARMKDLVMARPLGTLDKGEYQRLAQAMAEDGLIKDAPVFEDFYRFNGQ